MRPMGVLITRTEPDASRTAEDIQALGHMTVIAPYAQIVQLNPPLPNNTTNGLIITSRHALDYIMQQSLLTSLPVYCVGEATATEASSGGLKIGHHAENSRALCKHLITLKPQHLLYVRGQEISTDIALTLKSTDHRVVETIVYEAKTTKTWPQKAVTAWNEGTINTVIFYSRRAAKTTESLITAYCDTSQTANITAYCISQNVANTLTLNWKNSIISANPTHASLLEKLQR